MEAALTGELAGAPWHGVLGRAEAAGDQAAEEARARFEDLAAAAGEGETRGLGAAPARRRRPPGAPRAAPAPRRSTSAWP